MKPATATTETAAWTHVHHGRHGLAAAPARAEPVDPDASAGLADPSAQPTEITSSGNAGAM
jgi:hypothetical protein